MPPTHPSDAPRSTGDLLQSTRSYRLPEGENARDPKRVLFVDADGVENEHDAKEVVGSIGEGEDAIKITAATAHHVFARHLSGDAPGSTFPTGYDVPRVLELVATHFDLAAVAEAQREGSGPLRQRKFVGTTRVEGAAFTTGVAALSDLQIPSHAMEAYEAVKNDIRQANRSGDEAAKRALADRFNALGLPLTLAQRFPEAPLTVMADVPPIKTDEFAIIVSDGELVTTMTGHHREALPFAPGQASLDYVKANDQEAYERLLSDFGSDEKILAALDEDFEGNQDDWEQAAFLVGKPHSAEAALDASPEQLNARRLERAIADACERYPTLAADIQRSLRTPQFKGHHCEGPTMESHLKLVVKTVYDVVAGVFPDEVDEETRAMLQQVASATLEDGARRPTVDALDYAVLHDIAKPDRMTLKTADKDAVEITWDQWEQIAARGEPYRVAVDGVEKDITGISYRHASEEYLGDHGPAGAAMQAPSEVPSIVITATAHHETTYNFSAISAGTYERKLGMLSEEEADFVFLAAYIDQMGSRTEDGESDLAGFRNMAVSRANLLLIEQAVSRERKAISTDNQNKLKNIKRALTPEDIRNAETREKHYDLSLFREALRASNALSAEQVEDVLLDPKTVGKRMGRVLEKPQMNAVKDAMKAAEMK